MDSAMRLVRDRASIGKLKLKSRIAPETPDLWVDRRAALQIFSNLLTNAVKFTRPRPEAVIELRGSVEGDEVVFSVKDNGVGFDMKYVGKLFGVFQRLHRTEDFPGTGIGLALVKRIVDRHGGTVSARGELESGAVVSFVIPKPNRER